MQLESLEGETGHAESSTFLSPFPLEQPFVVALGFPFLRGRPHWQQPWGGASTSQ